MPDHKYRQKYTDTGKIGRKNQNKRRCYVQPSKNFRLKKRNANFIESVPDEIIFEAVDIISSFIEIEE